MIGRRWVIGAMAWCLAGMPMTAQADVSNAKLILDKFASVKSMSGSFIQFGPRGDQSEGTFSLERPGKVRFEYDRPSPLTVVADGRSVGVENNRLKTWDLYPLSKTPIKLLLDEKIDLSDKMVKRVVEKDGLVSVLLEDESMFGNSTIEVTFDKTTFDLRQWTIADQQNQETTVMLHSITVGVSFEPSTFRIPYEYIRKLK